jgi:membrane protein implicated in regulation of membrane protease activity
MVTVYWLCFAVLMFLVEAATVGLVSIWFGIGAVAAMLCSFVTANIYIQFAVFILVSAVTMATLKKRMKIGRIERTNAQSAIDKVLRLTEPIAEDGLGRVKMGDVSWNVKLKDGSSAKDGDRVKVVAIEGNKLIVEKI